MPTTLERLNAGRLAELQRRVNALPVEVAAWVKRSGATEPMKIHHTQVKALKALMDEMLDGQSTQIQQLSPSALNFSQRALQITQEVIRVQQIWDFFRDELALRFSPDFQDALWVADTVAWNCHRQVLEEASAGGVINLDEAREPPLTQVIAEFSPATWVRGSQPNDGVKLFLGNALLPIPVIQVPADHLVNSWELLSIAHEVGHDLEPDLKLTARLEASLDAALTQAGVPAERKAVWQLWRKELFADLVGLQLAGPAFARSLMSLLLLPEPMVIEFNPQDVHPTHYVRILINAAYVRTLIAAEAKPGVQEARARLDADATALEADWKAAYPTPSQDADLFLKDAPVACTALVGTSFPELKGLTVRALMPFTAADDVKIRAAADYLATGQNAPQARSFPKIRHCLSAARMAADRFGAADVGKYLQDVDTRTRQLVRDNTPDVVRGSESAAHLRYVQSFAATLLKAEG